MERQVTLSIMLHDDVDPHKRYAEAHFSLDHRKKSTIVQCLNYQPDVERWHYTDSRGQGFEFFDTLWVTALAEFRKRALATLDRYTVQINEQEVLRIRAERDRLAIELEPSRIQLTLAPAEADEE